MSSLILSNLLTCPKYLGFIALFSIYMDYNRDPKWMDWRWFLLMSLSVINVLIIIYKRYKAGISIGIISDILWIAVSVEILYLYALKFSNKDDVNERVKNDKTKIASKLPWIVGFGLVVSILILIACICQFIPVVNVVAIPLMRVLSFVI